jgi:hypothetical protein
VCVKELVIDVIMYQVSSDVLNPWNHLLTVLWELGCSQWV